MNAHGNERIFIRLVAGIAQGFHHVRAYAVNSKRDELIAIGGGSSRGAQLVNEIGSDAENPE